MQSHLQQLLCGYDVHSCEGGELLEVTPAACSLQGLHQGLACSFMRVTATHRGGCRGSKQTATLMSDHLCHLHSPWGTPWCPMHKHTTNQAVCASAGIPVVNSAAVVPN